ncbi:MAG: response regulator transcription factor [Bifidobacterium sp.]|jgi:DNA-binding NarL/FixJ family response regulator|nr:response regulator transcription factor [Bifidobacterium sp.]
MNRNRSIRIIIADDQELVGAGFTMVINSQADMHVVGQAHDGDEAVTLARKLHPDVVLMDVRMPGVNGIEATRLITQDNPSPAGQGASPSHGVHAFAADDAGGMGSADPTGADLTGADPEKSCGDGGCVRVIILTTFDLDEYVMAAINAGASGFLLKDTEPETLLSSIRTVFHGNAIIAPSATKRLIEKMMEDGYTSGSPDAGRQREKPSEQRYTDPELEELTDREREVLIEIAHGLSNQEIADRLFISLPTVKTHVAHILAKINARDRVQAVVFAYDNHLV